MIFLQLPLLLMLAAFLRVISVADRLRLLHARVAWQRTIKRATALVEVPNSALDQAAAEWLGEQAAGTWQSNRKLRLYERRVEGYKFVLKNRKQASKLVIAFTDAKAAAMFKLAFGGAQ